MIATITDGSIIEGESNISKATKKIVDLKLKENSVSNIEAVNAIKNADLIIFGPGSLYTSIIPNLLFPRLRESINQNIKAKKLLITSIMSQPGETDDFSIRDFKVEIEKYWC